jgi:hypothetical protein
MNQNEFYKKIPEWISKPKSTWNHITLMAYFCHKYEVVHSVRFRLVRWNSDPGKGKESRDFAKLFKTLSPENYSSLPVAQKKAAKEEVIIKIYNYINWMFDYKFRRGDKSVTGTKIFLLPSMINEFERMYSGFLSKNREDNKISSLISWAKENAPGIFSLHQLECANDLKMLQKYINMYSLQKDSLESTVLQRAKEMMLI